MTNDIDGFCRIYVSAFPGCQWVGYPRLPTEIVGFGERSNLGAHCPGARAAGGATSPGGRAQNGRQEAQKSGGDAQNHTKETTPYQKESEKVISIRFITTYY